MNVHNLRYMILTATFFLKTKFFFRTPFNVLRRKKIKNNEGHG